MLQDFSVKTCKKVYLFTIKAEPKSRLTLTFAFNVYRQDKTVRINKSDFLLNFMFVHPSVVHS